MGRDRAAPAPLTAVVDARGLDASGIGRYLREVLKRLLHDERFRKVTLLGSRRSLEDFAHSARTTVDVAVEEYDHGFYSLSAQASWLRLTRRGRLDADVVFLPHYDGPVVALPRRSVVTVQDLIHFKVPGTFPLAKRAGAGVLLDRVCRQAGRIIVTSTSTAADLHERLPFTRRKTEIVPLGVSSDFLAGPEDRPAGARTPAGRFLLCVGNRKPHKNHVAAVEVLSRLAREHPDLSLVIAGRSYPGNERVSRRAKELGVAERLLEIETPSDDELRDLYRHCSVFLFPSLYEGFGLPVLEAMACGAPVIAARRASIPEVAGEAAILVDPINYDDMAAASRRLLGDGELRARLAQKGRQRAQGYSWETTGARVIESLVGTAIGRPPLMAAATADHDAVAAPTTP